MRFILSVLFLLLALRSQPQENSNTAPQTETSTSFDHWNIEKYLWSHKHTVTSRQGKRPMNFGDIENHISLSEEPNGLCISPDGQYFAYSIQNTFLRRQDTLIIQATENKSKRQSFSNADPGFFTADSKLYVFYKQSSLWFLKTKSYQLDCVKDVINFAYSSEENGKVNWLAYKLRNNQLVLQNMLTGYIKNISEVSSFQFDQSGSLLTCQLNHKTKELMTIDLSTGKELRFKSVIEYLIHNSGRNMATITIDYENNVQIKRLQLVSLPKGNVTTVWSSTDSNANVINYSFDRSGKQIVFTVQESLPASRTGEPRYEAWYYQAGMKQAVIKVNETTEGMEPGCSIQNVTFTDNNNYILLTLEPPKNNLPEFISDAVKIDIWNYKDKVLQSTQPYLLQKPKTFRAAISITGNRLIRLGSEDEIWKGYKITSDFVVIGKTGKEAHGDRFWESGYQDDYNWLLSLKDGSRKMLATSTQQELWFSPTGKYLVYYDKKKGGNYFSIELNSGNVTNVSQGITAFQLAIEEYYQRPVETIKYAVGIAGWLERDSALLVYDNYDIWQLDLAGKCPPINITNGYGRRNKIRFALTGYGIQNQYWSAAMEVPILPCSIPLLLRASNLKNKQNGIYQKILGTMGDPELLCMGPYTLNNLPISTKNIPYTYSYGKKACKAFKVNKWIIKRESATQAPNYYITQDFKEYHALTNIQPQQKYNWLTAELHDFKQLDGTTSQGVLYKPENFDSSKQYPVIISFYTVLSDKVHQYPNPAYLISPNAIKESPGWMVSHGYLVFTPDIYFTKGQWGPSTTNSIEGAARYLKTLKYVDKNLLGAAGHSNSGRFAFYLLAHSRTFAAMAVGEGTTDIISNGFALKEPGEGSNLEWAEETSVGTGLRSLWENKDTWLNHSTLLHADKITSPLLLFDNKDKLRRDQAAALFTALRRLGKKAWWLHYDEGGHVLRVPRDMKDFTIRYTQYFDHYLKKAPAPRWMTQGIPFKLKGLENGYELDREGNCGENCLPCQSKLFQN